MGHLSLELLVGSLFCLAHLGIGIAVGARMSRTVMVGSVPRTDPALIPQQVIDWNEIRARLAELSAFTQSVQSLPLPELRQRKDDLIDRVSGLHSAIEGKPFVPAAQEEPQEKSVEPSKPEPGVLTNEQILAMLEGATFERAPPSMPMPRHKFAVTQPIAMGGSDGALTKILHVQCHDLSVSDVRYLVDDPPAVERVVIGLGIPKPVKWLAGTVEDFHSVFMYGRVGYLVTVRFVANVDHQLAL